MDDKTILKIIVALIFSVFIGIGSILGPSLEEIVYNPFILIPLFFVIFYLIIQFELFVISKYIVNKKIKMVYYTGFMFLSVLIGFIIYSYSLKSRGLGDFKSYGEQSNFIYSLFKRVFLDSIILFTILGTFLTSIHNKKTQVKNLMFNTIFNLVIFGLNYILALLMIPIFEGIFFAISLGR